MKGIAVAGAGHIGDVPLSASEPTHNPKAGVRQVTVSAEPASSATAISGARTPRIHLIDPNAFVRYGRERAWCGTFGAQYSPLVEHPDDANCQRCERRLRAWEAKNVSDAHPPASNGAIGPDTPPTDGPARTVEVSDRTGQPDPDLP